MYKAGTLPLSMYRKVQTLGPKVDLAAGRPEEVATVQADTVFSEAETEDDGSAHLLNQDPGSDFEQISEFDTDSAESEPDSDNENESLRFLNRCITRSGRLVRV